MPSRLASSPGGTLEPSVIGCTVPTSCVVGATTAGGGNAAWGRSQTNACIIASIVGGRGTEKLMGFQSSAAGRSRHRSIHCAIAG